MQNSDIHSQISLNSKLTRFLLEIKKSEFDLSSQSTDSQLKDSKFKEYIKLIRKCLGFQIKAIEELDQKKNINDFDDIINLCKDSIGLIKILKNNSCNIDDKIDNIDNNKLDLMKYLLKYQQYKKIQLELELEFQDQNQKEQLEEAESNLNQIIKTNTVKDICNNQELKNLLFTQPAMKLKKVAGNRIKELKQAESNLNQAIDQGQKDTDLLLKQYIDCVEECVIDLKQCINMIIKKDIKEIYCEEINDLSNLKDKLNKVMESAESQAKQTDDVADIIGKTPCIQQLSKDNVGLSENKTQLQLVNDLLSKIKSSIKEIKEINEKNENKKAEIVALNQGLSHLKIELGDQILTFHSNSSEEHEKLMCYEIQDHTNKFSQFVAASNDNNDQSY